METSLNLGIGIEVVVDEGVLEGVEGEEIGDDIRMIEIGGTGAEREMMSIGVVATMTGIVGVRPSPKI